MVFKDMDIGTAKPTKEELLQYPHHLIDIISPLEVYSAANFVEDACDIRLIDIRPAFDQIAGFDKTEIRLCGFLHFRACDHITAVVELTRIASKASSRFIRQRMVLSPFGPSTTSTRMHRNPSSSARASSAASSVKNSGSVWPGTLARIVPETPRIATIAGRGSAAPSWRSWWLKGVQSRICSWSLFLLFNGRSRLECGLPSLPSL